ncbi:MAG: GNAT family protein [Pseudomonadota bacterium]
MLDDFWLAPLDPEQHAEAMHEILGDEDSCRYLFSRAFKDVSETRRQLEKWVKSSPETEWVILACPSQTPVGRVTIYTTGDEVWEAGVMICPDARGLGLGGRALQKGIDFIFENMPCRRIAADIDPENVGSIRTFQKLGFTYEGRLRARWRTHLGVRDADIYSLLPSDPRPWR